MSQTDLQRFGARVRTQRERLGMSQEDLADKAGLHRTYLGGVERGERNIGVLNVMRIARALGISPAVLFEETSRTSSRRLHTRNPQEHQ